MQTQLDDLRVLVEQVVADTLQKSYSQHGSPSMMGNPNWRDPLLSQSMWYPFEKSERNDGLLEAKQIIQADQLLSKILSDQQKKDENWKKVLKDSEGLAGLAGMYSAYQTGDAIGGAMSGAQAFSALKLGSPVVGAVVGLLAGLLSPGIDRWQRPTFKKAKQAYDKLFVADRGERDMYYLPDSYYFRAGGDGGRPMVVRIGNEQIDDFIRESVTDNYSSQLERGLVF